MSRAAGLRRWDTGAAVLPTLVASLLLCGAPAVAEPAVSIVPLGFEASEFRGSGSRVAATVGSTDAFRESRPALAGPLVVVWGPRGGAVLTLAEGAVLVRPAARGFGDFAALERGRDALPGSRVQAAGALTVQLEGPSRDYPHEALGSAIHASTLVIAERQPASPTPEAKPVARAVTRVAAGPGAVFEDREPHLVDLDRDGTPEILVVRSYRDRGSALAVVARRGAGWQIVAETPPNGEPFQWLNPIATLGEPGLFALVRRPHLDGLLQVWRFAAERLQLVAEKAGYANHAYGSTAQDLAASLPGEGGALRIAVPTLDRRAIAILTLAGSALSETARIPLPVRALTGLAVLGRGETLHLLVGLEDGRVADVRP